MKHLLVSAFALASAAILGAAPLAFDFNDPKKVNNIVFKTDAPLESINGTASGITGIVKFDPANVAATTGRIVVDAASLQVPNPTMQGHLQGNRWLDVQNHATITFEVSSLANVKGAEGTFTADATGAMTIKGVTRTITVPVRLTYLPGKLRARGGSDKDGDLLVVRSTFNVLRSDFGINAGQNEDKVSNEVTLTLSLAGIHVKG